MNILHTPAGRLLAAAACGLATVVMVGCERPPTEEVQLGYRGVGQELVVNPRLLAENVAETMVPAPEPPAAPVPIKASQSYPELKVLGDLSITEFNRLMAAMTKWVAPTEQGCAYCHNLENMASYEKYTKTVALSMLKMTQDTNARWKDHVGDTGVTCWTCHRGNAVPRYVWTSEPRPDQPERMVPAWQNTPKAAVAYASLPYDPLTAFLDRADTPISVVSATALPTGHNDKGIKHAEYTYGLMMYMTDALGVNCTYCHNSRAFYSWEQPTRVKAWYAIRHVREMNRDYIWPLTDILPESRKGPLGDPMRIACMTCHQGAYKPLYGAPMLKDYETALGGPLPGRVVDEVPAESAPEAPAPVGASVEATLAPVAPPVQADAPVQVVPVPAPAPEGVPAMATEAAVPAPPAVPAPVAPQPTPGPGMSPQQPPMMYPGMPPGMMPPPIPVMPRMVPPTGANIEPDALGAPKLGALGEGGAGLL